MSGDEMKGTAEGQWKCGNEFLPYHPQASHVEPAYRDGWNACYRAAQAHVQPKHPAENDHEAALTVAYMAGAHDARRTGQAPAPAPEALEALAHLKAEIKKLDALLSAGNEQAALAGIRVLSAAAGLPDRFIAPQALAVERLIPQGFRVEHRAPSGALTDEANDRTKWLVERTEAPYTGRDRLSKWTGPTLADAMRAARESLPADLVYDVPAQRTEDSNG